MGRKSATQARPDYHTAETAEPKAPGGANYVQTTDSLFVENTRVEYALHPITSNHASERGEIRERA